MTRSDDSVVGVVNSTPPMPPRCGIALTGGSASSLLAHREPRRLWKRYLIGNPPCKRETQRLPLVDLVYHLLRDWRHLPPLPYLRTLAYIRDDPNPEYI